MKIKIITKNIKIGSLIFFSFVACFKILVKSCKRLNLNGRRIHLNLKILRKHSRPIRIYFLILLWWKISDLLNIVSCQSKLLVKWKYFPTLFPIINQLFLRNLRKEDILVFVRYFVGWQQIKQSEMKRSLEN